MIYAAGIIILILALGVIHEHHERFEAEERVRFWQKDSAAADKWACENVAALRTLRKQYDALAAEQNGTKRRAIRAELAARASKKEPHES